MSNSRQRLFFLCLNLLFFGSSIVVSPTHADDLLSPQQLLVEGELTVDVMGEVVSPRQRELMDRFRKALQSNPKLLAELSAKAKPGQGLPYDSKLGLTEEEYEEFQKSLKELKQEKVAAAKLSISVKEPNVIVLKGDKALADLSGVEIDFNKNEIRTPFGIVADHEASDVKQALVGTWKGTSWILNKNIDEAGARGALSVRISIGQLDTGRGLFVYDVKKLNETRRVRISHVLQFDPPAKSLK